MKLCTTNSLKNDIRNCEKKLHSAELDTMNEQVIELMLLKHKIKLHYTNIRLTFIHNYIDTTDEHNSRHSVKFIYILELKHI